jgi:hypothetical protein
MKIENFDLDKQIVIREYNDFSNTPKSDIYEHIQNYYKNGYWNVFIYSKVLEDFLIENKISYIVKNL